MLKKVIIFIFLIAYSLMSVHDIIPHHHHDKENEVEHHDKHHEEDHENHNIDLDDIIAFHEHYQSETMLFLADNISETVSKFSINQFDFSEQNFGFKLLKVPLKPLFPISKKEFFPQYFYISFPLRAPPIV